MEIYLMSHSETQWVSNQNKVRYPGKYALESQLNVPTLGDPDCIYVWDQAANEWGYSPTWLPLAARVWNMMQVQSFLWNT